MFMEESRKVKLFRDFFLSPVWGRRLSPMGARGHWGAPASEGTGSGCTGRADRDGGDEALHGEEIWHVLLFCSKVLGVT